MAVKFPCELVGWTILPAIRKELTFYLVKEKKIERKKVCEILGLTPAALSQYIKGKRASGVKLSNADKKRIHSLGDYLIKGKKISEKNFISHSCEVCKKMKEKMICCD
ncbi:MAG: transcriptional regulator [Candidatus Diapherotrites archaeon]|nr:transcriptional regulator [Candidatus Diapherotrites archaeon]